MAAPIFHMAAGAPNPVAPFSHAVEVDDWVLVTGQMPNEAGNEDAPLPPDIEGQTKNVMKNLQIVLGSLDSSLLVPAAGQADRISLNCPIVPLWGIVTATAAGERRGR